MNFIPRIADKFYRKVFRCFDWFLVPLENRLLNIYIRRNPARFQARLTTCVEKGLRFFETRPTLSFDALFAFTLVLDESIEPRVGPLGQKIHAYKKEWKDPHLRILDRNYDPDRHGASCPKTFNVEELSPPEIPIIKCLYADKLGLAEDYLTELNTIDDCGGYGTTHILIGCALLKTYSTIPHEAINKIMKKAIASIAKAQRHSRIEDIYSERTVLLQWFGDDSYIQPAWVYRIMSGQMANGGWYEFRSLFGVEADQHASCLGLAALILYRENQLHGRVDKPKYMPLNFGDFPILPQQPEENKKTDHRR